ncbi:MAG: hypothetical protein Q8R96_17080 [Bacteroidota bacterium]|nr:hypothetical protein [Bacteroidota bacterium]
MKRKGITLVLVVLINLTTFLTGMSQEAVTPFKHGEKVPFLGIFTHTEPVKGLDDQIISAGKLLENNHYIAGLTLKIKWKDFHPEKDKIEWQKLETLISMASSMGKLVTFALISGYSTPNWVIDSGTAKIQTKDGIAPVPWDTTYMRLFSDDVKAISKLYANDDRVTMVEVLGHQFRGEEMHAPNKDLFMEFGWSKDVVVANWKYWINLYDSLYPKKKLDLIVSQMYDGTPELPELVAAYFLEKCAERAVLQTDQINGREGGRIPGSGELCKKFSDLVPNCHEMVGSFKEQPERQGTVEMTIYNFKQMGNPYYLQLWRRDCDDPAYAKALLDVWEKYKEMTVSQMKNKLVKEGLYIEKSTWNMGNFLKNKQHDKTY